MQAQQPSAKPDVKCAIYRLLFFPILCKSQ